MGASKSNEESRVGANRYDAVIRGFDFVTWVIDKGHIVSVFLLLAFSMIMVFLIVIAVKIPQEHISPTAIAAFDVAGSQMVGVGFFVGAILILGYFCKRKINVYREECKRLAKQKSHLIHNNKGIMKHTSSQWEDKEE